MNDVLRIARLKIALQRAFLGRAILRVIPPTRQSMQRPNEQQQRLSSWAINQEWNGLSKGIRIKKLWRITLVEKIDISLECSFQKLIDVITEKRWCLITPAVRPARHYQSCAATRVLSLSSTQWRLAQKFQHTIHVLWRRMRNLEAALISSTRSRIYLSRIYENKNFHFLRFTF